MAQIKAGAPEWLADEIIVRLLNQAEGGAASTPPGAPEAGVYDPVFSVWDGAPLLDFLFAATGKDKPGSGYAKVLLLNLRLLPENDAEFLL
jgi:hypothetical protein